MAGGVRSLLPGLAAPCRRNPRNPWLRGSPYRRGEADIGDRVERLQALHHHLADPAPRASRFRRWSRSGAGSRRRAARSARAATGRLRQAIAIERSSLARSNGSRRSSDLTTVSSRSWTRSKVVKRAPQSSHWRRRRIERAVLGGTAVLHLAVLMGAERAAQLAAPDRSGSGRRAPRRGACTAASTCAVALLAILAQALEHVGDHVADLAELGGAEAAGGAGGRADADAAGLDRRQRIERDRRSCCR